MFRGRLLPSLLAAACLTQITLCSPTGPITEAPNYPIPTAAIRDLLRHHKRDPFTLPSIDWSGLTPESILPWLFGDDTTVLPTATVATGGGGAVIQCSTYNIPGGTVATLCATGPTSVTGELGTSLATSTSTANGGGIGTGIGTGIGSSPSSAGGGASSSGPITSFTSASRLSASAVQSGNLAPQPSRGLYLNIAVVVPVLVLGAAL